MADFKIFDSALTAHFDPFSEILEVKIILSAVFADFNKLNCSSLAADHCIKRRSENGGQNAVHSVLCRHFDEIAVNPPIFVAERLNAVIIADAIGMIPAGINPILFGKHSINDFNLRFALYGGFSVLFYLNANRIFSRFASVRAKLNPEAVPPALFSFKSVADGNKIIRIIA